MKLAFVGPAGATPARLEELLLALVDRRGVDHIVPVGAAQAEVSAVLRGRERRFPLEVAWTSSEYPDFVLAAVLDGVGDRLRGEYLAALLVDPARVIERRHGDRALPSGEAADVAAYLAGLRAAPALPGSAPPQ